VFTAFWAVEIRHKITLIWHAGMANIGMQVRVGGPLGRFKG